MLAIDGGALLIALYGGGTLPIALYHTRCSSSPGAVYADDDGTVNAADFAAAEFESGGPCDSGVAGVAVWPCGSSHSVCCVAELW